MSIKLRELIEQAREQGYNPANARAKVCQDIVLKAIAESSMSRNVTIKGGVVMRSISNDIRRATQDLDMDFIRYSLADDSIDAFIRKLNCLPELRIERVGRIRELKQQDYHGKRVFIRISDEEGTSIDSKLDLGVHKHLNIEQIEYCFNVGFDEEGANLLANGNGQMFTEKLRSILKFGEYSTRYRDIFDLYYLKEDMDEEDLKECLNTLIINDPGMRETSLQMIVERFEKSAESEAYMRGLERTDKNWLEIDPEIAVRSIVDYLNDLQ